MEVSFTKINDDVLVPSHLFELKDGIPLKHDTVIWYGLGGVWLFGILTGAKFGYQAILFCTGITLFIGLILYITLKLPFGWIELNRKEGTVTIWTSAKKRKRVAMGNFTDFRVDWIRHRVVTSKYSAEIRYSLGLFRKKGEKKYSKTLLDGKKEVQFCFLYDMVKYDTSKAPDNLPTAEYIERLTQKAAVFLDDFFLGKPLPETKNNVYQITI